MRFPLFVALITLPALSALAGREFQGSREGPRGGSVSAEGQQWGRYRSGSVEAEGPNGGTYDASGTRVGRFSTGSSTATGPNGNTVDRSGTAWRGPAVGAGTTSVSVNGTTTSFSGYRTGYVYSGGVYRPANVTVNSVYVAPVGVFAGWSVMTLPVYVQYPVYATYPVQVAVQVQLQQQGYYGGPIDGNIGPQTQAAISKYQSLNGLPATGQINKALLKSLNIST
jgi:hypothetical protein